MKPLLIATSNKYRANKLRNIISRINPNIEVNVLKEESNKPFQEKGDDVESVVKQKIERYRQCFGTSVLVEDDGLYLNIKNSPNAKIKRDKFKTTEEVFEYWYQYLKENDSISGYLRKGYGLITEKNVQIKILDIPITLISLDEKPLDICYNPLNHFIKPEGANKVIGDFDQNDWDIYDQNIKNTLKSLFDNYE